MYDQSWVIFMRDGLRVQKIWSLMAVRWNSSLELMASSTVEAMVLSVLEAMTVECGSAKRVRMMRIVRDRVFARTKLLWMHVKEKWEFGVSETCNLMGQLKVQM